MYIYVNRIRKHYADSNLQFADSTYTLWTPLTVAESATAQLNYKMSYDLFVDSTNCSGFRKYGCGFRKIAYFRIDFERYSVLGIGLWNPKQQRRSKKVAKLRIPRQI